jgi:hypothetical protein
VCFLPNESYSVLGTGTGSEIRQPLGYAIVGGLIVSQALTLFTTPVIYLFFGRIAAWVAPSRGPAKTADLVPVPRLTEGWKM